MDDLPPELGHLVIKYLDNTTLQDFLHLKNSSVKKYIVKITRKCGLPYFRIECKNDTLILLRNKLARKLKKLECYHFSPKITNFMNLTSLTLSTSRIKTEDLGILTHLITLKLVRCNLSNGLPESLINLKMLMCQLNNLTHIPTTYQKLKILVCFNEYQLSEIPKELIQLKKLSVSFCTRIQSIPETLQNLESLRIGFCGIRVFPSNFPNLTSLNFYQSKRFIGQAIIIPETLQKLKFLSLGGWNIEAIPKVLTNLQRLRLYYCSIHCIIPNLPNLIEIVDIDNLHELDGNIPHDSLVFKEETLKQIQFYQGDTHPYLQHCTNVRIAHIRFRDFWTEIFIPENPNLCELTLDKWPSRYREITKIKEIPFYPNLQKLTRYIPTNISFFNEFVLQSNIAKGLSN